MLIYDETTCTLETLLLPYYYVTRLTFRAHINITKQSVNVRRHWLKMCNIFGVSIETKTA